MMVWKIRLVLNFRFDVNLPGCICNWLVVAFKPSEKKYELVKMVIIFPFFWGVKIPKTMEKTPPSLSPSKETNISPTSRHSFEDPFPFPKM